MKKVLLLLLSASVLWCTTPNLVSANKLEQMLRDHTFIYTDIQTGIEHTIYIGRFGNNYDEYFPCKFIEGFGGKDYGPSRTSTVPIKHK